MTALSTVRVFVLVGLAVAGAFSLAPASAQQQPQLLQPSPAAMALAREVINLKDGMAVFNALIPGVIEQAKGIFAQQNPMLQRPLNDVGADLRKELEPRRAEIVEILARVYAQRFTEAELKDIVAFYKTPAGKKMLTQEPNAIDAAFTEVQTWAQNLEQVVINRVRAEMKKKGHDL